VFNCSANAFMGKYYTTNLAARAGEN
jgi:hypothetical protein